MAKQNKKTEDTKESIPVKEVRVLKPLWGKFNLPYPVGSTAKMPVKLADTVIGSGYGMSEEEAKKLEESEAKENKEADQDQE